MFELRFLYFEVSAVEKGQLSQYLKPSWSARTEVRALEIIKDYLGVTEEFLGDGVALFFGAFLTSVLAFSASSSSASSSAS